ncbi:PepSY domain-containing protein [Thiocapsa rosea]|uniref:Peptidase YpeB-like protein n=1 Tax=Thiocapsa rosea TaxID=69360 RepID=A0A495V4X5_9GAMM|nr:PepSY domain-containing protein [Thiocapsa rosea]RKT43645.1 peptidase YpeB-like protein [Thiocapsa rosea]
MKRHHLMATTGLGLLLAMGNPLASERLDHDEIKQLRGTGAILPMEQAMASAESVQPGQLVEAELERKDSTYRYEITILAADGTAHKLYLDAATGDVIRRKEK